MADVHMVCVDADLEPGEALAETLKGSGYSIGGAPLDNAALQSCGAGLIVWSRAAVRSPAFIQVAGRLIAKRKAIIAGLAPLPSPDSLAHAPAFDLTHWDGWPRDPALDPLYSAVSQQVGAARSSLLYPAASGLLESPLRTTAHHDPNLLMQVKYWRRIQHSLNPSDYMDYLTQFGADGAFSDLAELRLRQLLTRRPSVRPRPERPAVVRAAAPPPPPIREQVVHHRQAPRAKNTRTPGREIVRRATVSAALLCVVGLAAAYFVGDDDRTPREKIINLGAISAAAADTGADADASVSSPAEETVTPPITAPRSEPSVPETVSGGGRERVQSPPREPTVEGMAITPAPTFELADVSLGIDPTAAASEDVRARAAEPASILPPVADDSDAASVGVDPAPDTAAPDWVR